MENSNDIPKRRPTPWEALRKVEEIKSRKEYNESVKRAERLERKAKRRKEISVPEPEKKRKKPIKEVVKIPANRRGMIRNSDAEIMRIASEQRKKRPKRNIAKTQA